MTIDRAIEILDPDHHESYDSLSTVEEACRMGMEALKLLKAQGENKDYTIGFTVIDSKTGKEADICKIARKEDWAAGLIYCDMEGWAIEENGSLILMDECGNYVFADRERFKVIWND